MADTQKVFDIEVSDRMSQGCGSHASPECLCDVDVSRTADIEWKRGPIELLGCQSGPELAQRWADWVYRNEIEFVATEMIPASTIGWGARWPIGALADADPEFVEDVVERLRSGQAATPIAKETGTNERYIVSLSRALGTNRMGHPSPPWRLYAMNRYAEGATAAEIRDEIEGEWGLRPKQKVVYSVVKRAGVKRGSAGPYEPRRVGVVRGSAA